jgi:hypothetical protein
MLLAHARKLELENEAVEGRRSVKDPRTLEAP